MRWVEGVDLLVKEKADVLRWVCIKETANSPRWILTAHALRQRQSRDKILYAARLLDKQHFSLNPAVLPEDSYTVLDVRNRPD